MPRVFALPGQQELGRAIANLAGFPSGEARVESFPDGERSVGFVDDLWGEIVVLVGSTGPPVDENTMALALLSDAARRAGAREVVAVIPYLGYSRSERLATPGTPVACRLVADLLGAAGVTRLVLLDLHSPAIVGFFTCPALEQSAVDLLTEQFRADPDCVVVAPDAGAVRRASRMACQLGGAFAVSLKERRSPTEPKVLRLCGDVAGRHAILLDDMVSTGRTVTESVEHLRAQGAAAVSLAATHAVLSDGAEERLRAIGLARVVFTDSLSYRPRSPWPELAIVSVAPLLASALRTVVR